MHVLDFIRTMHSVLVTLQRTETQTQIEFYIASGLLPCLQKKTRSAAVDFRTTFQFALSSSATAQDESTFGSES